MQEFDDQIDHEAVEESEDSEESAEPARKELMLAALGNQLETKFRKYSGDREFKENEWTSAIRQYEGQWAVDESDKAQQSLWGKDSTNLPPPVNITRPKTNIAISRMQDSQFPVGGDFNFILEPSPLPELFVGARSVTDPTADMRAEAAAAGVPADQVPSPQEIVQDIEDEARMATIEMTKQIQDDLVRTSYGQKARLAIEDLAVLGSAVIKGPVLTPHVRRVYMQEITEDGETIHVLGSRVEHKADVFRVDPRLVYPDPSARLPNEIEDIFELHIMSKTELVKLAESPAFMRGQISKVIERGTDISSLPSSITDTSYMNSGVITDNRYVVKEYHGPLDKTVLLDGELISEEDAEDNLAMFFGEVWCCNGIVIRMSLQYLEGISSVPYGIASWERDPSSVFGHGVPYLIRNPQRVINSAYLMLLDNAALTSGPQIVLNKEMIEPAVKADGYDIEPMKVWFLTEYGADVREAMQFVNVPAQMTGIASIIDLAMQFSDLESATPLIQQGDLPSGNNTLTGVGKVMSATNINQKRASMNWDDYITVGLIERMYHHNMQYGSNEKAKGDMEVRVGGATERIDAEIRAQELERLLGMAASNPSFNIQINPTKAFRQLATLIRAGDILRTAEEVAQAETEQQAQAQADPATITAQAAMATAQARQQEAQTKMAALQNDAQLDQIRLQIEQAVEQAKLQAIQQTNYVQLQIAQDEREMSLIKMAYDRDISVQALTNQLQVAVINNETARQKIASNAQQFNAEIAIKQATGEGI